MKWEYTVQLVGDKNVTPEAAQKVLNSSGSQEWELVSVVTTAYSTGGTEKILAFFKRLKL